MPAWILRTIVIVAAFSNGPFALAGEQLRHLPSSRQGSDASSRSSDTLKSRRHAHGLKQNDARTSAADHDRYADPAAPYGAGRLSSARGEATLNVPGQTTILTRQVLDDMNATSLKGALRSTAGMTVGR
jgi:outer membrane receptor for monomeric catechols